MGLDVNGTKFLLYARQQGVSFAETAMIGRQSLLLDTKSLQNNLNYFGFQTAAAREILIESDGYAEPFLKLLGAREIKSFDASDYETASEIHDFNLPIPGTYKNKFSVVLDGGTLEHIFNFPAAIKNCLEMVREGGHFLNITPTNNQLGHGFYQFSPELFFRILTAANGFQIERIFIFENYLGTDWYEVTDPEKVFERVTLTNRFQSFLMIIAKKVETVEIFQSAPQQSDYSAMWQNGDIVNAANAQEIGLIKRLVKLPRSILGRCRRRLNQPFSMLEQKPEHFKKMKF